jgi:MYXO-CTERM domain-containing protein
MRLAAGLLVILPATAAAAPVPRTHACMGPWVGVGDQRDGTVPWSILLNMTASASGGRCGTIEYESSQLHCGGTLDECDLVGEDIHTREVYTYGQETCAPPSKVVIRCEGDRMRFSWIGSNGVKEIQVDTMLRRPDGYVDPRMSQPAGSGSAAPPKPKPRKQEPSKTDCSCAGGGDGGSSAGLVAIAALLALRRRS